MKLSQSAELLLLPNDIMKAILTFAIFTLVFCAACTKTASTVSATYILFDSTTYSVNKSISLQITPGSDIVYNGQQWTYQGGYYFNGLNYIYLYATNNDSIYIDYPDTANRVLTMTYLGYKQ